MVPPHVGRYEILGRLATGGMAEVLLARLSGPGDFARAVVIKRILPCFADDREFVAMFLDEARIVAKLRHTNVVQIQELGQEDGNLFLVLEYVPGENLASVIKRASAAGEPLGPGLSAHVIAAACAGLHAAHELDNDDGRSQNLVHRDVSPQNVLVGYDGHVKLLDFGIARTTERIARTAVGDVKGKIEYMSPEQASGGPLDRRSDVFGMGVVLYELTTGRRLFKRANKARTVEAILKEPIARPSRLVDGFDPALEEICMRALARDPAERYATAAEMRRALLEIARSEPSPADAIAQRMQRWFADRIEERAAMLRRPATTSRPPVTSSEPPIAALPPSPGSPPPAAWRAPAPPHGTTSESAPPRAASEQSAEIPPVEPPRTGGRTRTLALGMGAAAVVAAALTTALAVAYAHTRPPASVADVPEGRTEAPQETAAVAPATDSPASETVVVQIVSIPDGATVSLEGKDAGTTPLELFVRRSADAVSLRLAREGHETTSQRLVPDADQKVVVALPAARGKPNRGPKAPKRR